MYFKSLVTGSLLAALLLVAASPVDAGKPLEERGWIEVTTRHFTIRSVRSEKVTLELARYLEAFHTAAATVTGFDGLDNDLPVEIYVLKKPRDATRLGMSRIQSARTIADGSRHTLVVRGVRWEDLHDAARHGYAHLFVSGRFPMWLDTGLAEYLAATKEPISPGYISVGLPPRYKLKVLRFWKPWLPMSDIVSAADNYDNWTPGAQRMFYSEAWVLVHYLYSKPGFTANQKHYLEMLQSGSDRLPAFETAFGIDVQLLNKDIKNYLTTSRFGFEKFELTELSELEVVRLTPPQIALGLADIARSLDETGQAGDWYTVAATDNQTRARAEAGFGRLLLSQGKHEAARSKMALALSLSPDDALCQLTMGQVMTAQAELTSDLAEQSALLNSARIHLLRSSELDDRNPLTHSALGNTYLIDQRFDDAIVHLETAAAGMPSSSLNLVRLAEAYAGANRKDEAIRAARVVVNILARPDNDNQAEPAARASNVIAAMSAPAAR